MKFISFVAVMILVSINVYSQNINYNELPSPLQLYPRDSQDSSVVDISGTVTTGGYDSIIVEIDTNNVLWSRLAQELDYSGGDPVFSFTPKIYVDTINFSFEVILKQNPSTESPDTLVDEVVCGDVYLINGQSNAVPQGGDAQNQWVRSFGDAANGQNAAMDTTWYLAKNGPPPPGTAGFIGTWGMRLGILIITNHGIPVCIIQQGEGGKPITYFSSGIGSGDPDSLKSYNFARLLYRTQNAGLEDNVNAIFWWQGEANTNESIVDSDYENQFLLLYNGWRTHFPGIQKVYTTQIHPGYGAYCDQMRELQRKIAEDSADIEIITPHNIGGFDGVQHFSTAGYQNYASKLYRLIDRDFYGSADTEDIDPPNIQKAYFTDSNKNVLVLEFDNTNPLAFQSDTTIGSTTYFLKDHFYFHNNGTIDTAIVDNIMVYTDKLRLALTQTSNADSVSYLPAQFYNGSTTIYDGPWVNNSRGVSALTFYRFPIDASFGDDPLPVTLSIFAAEYVNGNIKLKWRTESEINNLGFILLRKDRNQQEYKQISSYEYDPALEGQGTTSQATDYEFIDSDITSGETYAYLLIDVDYSGNKTQHGPLTLTAIEGIQPQDYNLFQNYPNPFNPSTTIAFFLPQQQHVLLRIFDILGKEVEILFDNQIPAGYHEIPFDASNLQSGHYFYEIRTADYEAVKKMLLIR